jgi:integrase
VCLLVVSLLYGAGLRLQEALELRVKDIDFSRGQVVVRRGKGQKDRLTLLPERLKEPLRSHLDVVRRGHQRDLADGFGLVVLPGALERSIRMRLRHGDGSLCSRRPVSVVIRALSRRRDTTYTSR